MKIVHPIARTVTLDLMPGGINVQFDAPCRVHLGKVNWHTNFRFEVSGREYWGVAFASRAVSDDIEMYSRGGAYGTGRKMAWNAKPHWRKVIMAEARDLVAEARALWTRPAQAGQSAADCDAYVANHYREQRLALRAEVNIEQFRPSTVEQREAQQEAARAELAARIDEGTATLERMFERNQQLAAYAASRNEVQGIAREATVMGLLRELRGRVTNDEAVGLVDQIIAQIGS